MSMRGNTHARLQQGGLVSIMVTLILMLVITLIVLGFSRVSRVEQRQSLDRQLSTQAFLAAESGVNDARKAIAASLANDGTIPEKDECENGPSIYQSILQPDIDGPGGVSYTCLLIDTSLPDIRVNVPVNDTVTIPIHPDPGPIRTVRLNWTAPDPVTFAGCPASVPAQPFPPSGSWHANCSYGVVRVDMVSTNDYSRAALNASQQAFFLYPTRGAAGRVPFGTPAAKGGTFPMSCNAAGCQVDIDVNQGANETWAMRLSSVYLAGSAQIRAYRPPLVGAQVNLKDAQVRIDSTGKAQDVLRRIQVRLSLAPSGGGPGQALISGSSICKRFAVSDTTFRVDTAIVGQDPNNPLCI